MKIGLITTDKDLQTFLSAQIVECQHEAEICRDLPQALATGVQLIFAEWAEGEQLPGLLAGLREVINRPHSVPVVMLVPRGSKVALNRARTAGATDVLYSPPDPEEIQAEIEDVTVATATGVFVGAERFRELRRTTLIGEDRAFLHCLEELRRAAKSEANILLVGETGTGKEMFAAAIHELSERAKHSFVAVNCAGLPGELLEAELFGHTKGAFTGAHTERAGRFGEVGGGTLMLDEIGDIAAHLQPKLLRAIETRYFQRLGENKDTAFRGRLICATSVDLEQALEERRFRRDLLGRIEQFRITLPALRERRTDIPLLAHHFLQKYAEGRPVEFSKTAMGMLEVFDYPMNIRQLANIVSSAVQRADSGRLILPKHLPPELAVDKKTVRATTDQLIMIPGALSYKEARELSVRAVDQIYLGPLLQKHGNNHSRVADEAGIDRKTLRDRLKHIGDILVEDSED